MSNPTFVWQDYLIPEGPWGGRFCIETEERDNYAPYVNNEGEIYLDCSKKKIWCKHVVNLVVRPFHGAVKIICTPITIALEIIHFIQKKQDFKTSAKWIFCHIVDLARTPIYTLAIEITSFAAILSGIFVPVSLFKTREIAGKLERSLYRVENNWDDKILEHEIIQMLFPCFSPFWKKLEVDQDNKPDCTNFDSALERINKFATRVLKLQREECILFNCGKLSQSKYSSPWFSETHLKEWTEKQKQKSYYHNAVCL